MTEEENVAEDATQNTETVFESAGDDSVAKIDLSKPVTEENEAEESSVDDDGASAAEAEDAGSTQEQEEVREEDKQEDKQEEEEEEEEVIEELDEEIPPATEIPENLQKLVDFMSETGGSLTDYVKLNSDDSTLSDMQRLKDYYASTKPHLDTEDIDLLLEDFSFDAEYDEEKDIRKTKIALKEELAKAKTHMDGLKSKYYAEIKGSSKLTTEQEEAVNFYSEYRASSESNEKQIKIQSAKFVAETDKVFNSEFKGFEYSAGDKSYRVELKDVEKTKANQADLSSFIGTFLDKNNVIKDAAGYHKAIYAAMNADALATHFYEQGKADAIKKRNADSKNIDMGSRKQHGKFEGGVKVRAVGGVNDNKVRLRVRR